MDFKKSLALIIEQRAKPIHIFLTGVLLYLLTYNVTGVIPVNNGLGWDGSVYLDYIVRLAAGEEIRGDPYRLVRISGFLPAMLAARLGVPAQSIVFFQLALNAVVLSASAMLFFKTLHFLTGRKLEALIVTGALFFSWPFLVMPVYYPLLSDHLGLAISVMAIWAWARSRTVVLLLLILFSSWVMPGLFVVPLLLAMMPIDRVTPSRDAGKSSRTVSALVLLGAASGFYYFIASVAGLPDDEIFRHPPGSNLGAPELRGWSILFLALGFSGVAIVSSRVFGAAIFWRGLAARDTMLALATLLVGFLSIRFLIDWNAGFRGPPLFYFLTLQASSAPLKPFVAHFLYFGPIFTVAMLSCLFYERAFKELRSFPLFLIVLAYVPILLMGSESRQWIAVFPVVVALIGMNQFNLRVLGLYFLFSLALCVPAFFLREGMAAAISDPLQSFSSEGWQLYFGRQGPWMSQRTYVIGLVSMLVFLMAYLSVQRQDTCK